MATEKIGFDITVNGVERTITSFKDLKKATKDLRDEQLVMSAKFGDTSEQAKKVGQKLADLKDKVEDLNDSTKSLKGSGVEKLTSSFRLLGDGLGTFDFDKIKLGFKGVGAAMSAIPIFLIIEGLKYLYDNFDKVIELSDDLTGATKEQTKSVEDLNSAMEKYKNLTDEVITSNKNYAARQIDVAKNAEKIKDLEAKGGDNLKEINNLKRESIKLEIQNLKVTKESQDGNLKFQDQLKSNIELAQKEKELQRIDITENAAALKDKAEKNKSYNDKRAGDEKKLLSDLENAKEQSYVRSLKSEQTQSIAKAQFDNDKLIEDINKSKASKATKNKALIQAEITLQENIAQIQKDYKVKQAAIDKTAADKKAADDKKIADDAKAEAIKVIQTKLSIIESGYQLELEKDKTKNSIKLQNVEKDSEEEKAILENADQEKLIKEKAHLEEIYKINIANAKLLNLDTTNLTNKYLQEKEALENAARDKKTEADKKAEADEKARKTQLHKDILESVNIAAQTTLSVQKTLSDTYYLKESQKNNKLYADKLKNVRQGSKEEKAILEQKAVDEKDLARKQFETQKKFNRASAILNGILGLGAIFAIPDPTLGILSAIRAVALVATTAANIAAINATQFDEGGATAGGIPAAADASPTTSQAPAIYGPGQGQSTTFSGNQNNNFAPVKAYVVETENRSTTNRVNKLVSESTYG